MKNQLVSISESNPVYYILTQIKLVVYVDTTNPNSDPLSSPKLVSVSESDLRDVGKILASDSLRRVAWYFLDHVAATSLILQFRADVAKGTIFRHINTLQKMGVITPAIRSRHPIDAKGGPRPTIWMLPDGRIDHVNDAQGLHVRLQSPRYLHAERMAQLMLDEYMILSHATVISKVNYIEFLREKQVKTSLIPDLVMLSVPYFREKGFKFLGNEGQKI